MKYRAEERAIVWLCALSGKEPRERVAALRAVRDPSHLKEAFEEDARKRTETFLRSLEENNIFALTVVSDDYPESLRVIPDPPLLLYGMGNRSLLQKKKLCIVGSRITPPWAEALCRRMAESLAENFVIVTGLAEGGDGAAIAGALPSGNLISVLPCGLAKCYPAAHTSLKERIAEKGLLLSEYPPEDSATKYAFHARNRLLAGLSEGVLVVSAGEKSGALITASRAAEYGRDVFAFPYNPGTSQGVGCNELLKKGAYVTTGVADILDCYGIEEKTFAAVELSPEEEKLLTILREQGELHAVALSELAGVPVYEATATLAALELKNLIVKSGGNRYTAV